jgi:hypothetical protein
MKKIRVGVCFNQTSIRLRFQKSYDDDESSHVIVQVWILDREIFFYVQIMNITFFAFYGSVFLALNESLRNVSQVF